MAKGKHAAALFEVIHAQKRKCDARGEGPGPLRTPKWWFKPREKSPPVVPSASPLEVMYESAASESAPSRSRLVLPISRSNALYGVIGTLALVAIVVIITRQFTRGPKQASGVPMDQVMKSPARPDAMKPNTQQSKRVAIDDPGDVAAPAPTQPKAPQAAPNDGKR